MFKKLLEHIKKGGVRRRTNRILITELDKIEANPDEEVNIDRLGKIRNLDSESVNRIWTFIKDIVGIILPIIAYGSWIRRGYEYEETGVVRSNTFRGVLNSCRKPK